MELERNLSKPIIETESLDFVKISNENHILKNHAHEATKYISIFEHQPEADS